MVLVHIFVIIGISLAGFCGHGSWGHEGHESHDFNPYRGQRAAHGSPPQFEPRSRPEFEPRSRPEFESRSRPDTFYSAKSTTPRPVTDDDIPDDHLTNILKDHEIIPDIIDSAPHVVSLDVTYDGGVTVNNGDELTVDETADRPIQINWEADENSYYTLLLVDPDAPSRLEATQRSWQHWIVVNILGKDISSGTVLTDYYGPSPPRGTGLHRYVFLLYEQENGKTVFREPRIKKTNTDRGKFSVREFSAKYRLGQPIAVNFFQTKQQQT